MERTREETYAFHSASAAVGAVPGSGIRLCRLIVDPTRGEQTVDLPVPGRNAEICVIPKHLGVGRYFDKDIQIETQLCNIDEHKNSAVCPKLNSTNPGLDLYSLPQEHLNAVADLAETRDFFVRELVFTANDYANIRKNLKDLATKLHQACLQGSLKLDLDLQAHFSNQSVKIMSCEP